MHQPHYCWEAQIPELVGTGAINVKGLNSRAARRDEVRIAKGNPDNASLNVNILIRRGRPPEVRSDMSQRVMAELKETFGDHFENGHLSLSMDIKEMRQDGLRMPVQ